MDQLGIKALRPGPSGNESAPNHANYDESKANPFPDLDQSLAAEASWSNEDLETRKQRIVKCREAYDKIMPRFIELRCRSRIRSRPGDRQSD